MVIATKLLVNNTQFSDYKKLIVNKTLGDFDISSRFTAEFDNPFGRHATSFNIGESVVIHASKGEIFSTPPYLHCKMNDDTTNTTITDVGTGGNNGTANANTDTLSDTGKINKAIRFDGSTTNVNFGDDIGFEFGSTDFTIMTWVYPEDVGTIGANGVIVGKYASSEYEYVLFLLGNKLILYLSDDGDNVTYAASMSGFVDSNIWSHITVVKEGTSVTFYINGDIQSKNEVGSVPATLYSGTASFIVGDTSSGEDEYKGLIDDIRIYKQALNASNISSIYNYGVGTEELDGSIIFNGTLEDIEFSGTGTRQKVVLIGRDYTSYLIDTTIEPVTYTNAEISTIVTDLINNNLTGITTDDIDTTNTIIERISFNQQSLFEAIKQLAKLANYIFYVTTTKSLVFRKKETNSTGITLNNTNVTSMRSNVTRDGMYNRIWVYGDKQLVGKKEIKNVGSPLAGGTPGSVFTMLFEPHNVNIDSSATPGSLLKGGVFQFGPAQSGTDFLVNFYDKQVILVSGTDLGYSSIPVSGGSLVINYSKENVISKFGTHRQSIERFGPRSLVINDKSIRDPRTALTILKDRLTKDSLPVTKTEINLKGWFTFNVGETVDVFMSDFGTDIQTLDIVSLNYTFTKTSELTENEVIKIQVDKRISNLVDSFTSIRDRLNRLEASDIRPIELLTKVEFGLGSVLVVGSSWSVNVRSIAGENLILDSPNFGILDVNKLVSGITYSFVLGKALAGVLGTSSLGKNVSTYTTLRSGGYSY